MKIVTPIYRPAKAWGEEKTPIEWPFNGLATFIEPDMGTRNRRPRKSKRQFQKAYQHLPRVMYSSLSEVKIHHYSMVGSNGLSLCLALSVKSYKLPHLEEF